MAVRARRYGRLYRGREGQWSWVAHRVTGVIIILFLFAHVVDTAVVGWGPNAYNKVIADRIGLSIKTVELYRARGMAKMQARSVAELTRMMVTRRV